MADNVTAFVLDDSVSAGDTGVTIPTVPGVWYPNQPVLPVALGLTLADLREAVKVLGLPLKEVKVPEREAADRFEHAVDFPSSPAGEPAGEHVVPVDPTIVEVAVDRSLELAEGDVDAVND